MSKPVLLHFRFDNFADLPSRVGEYVRSEMQTDCNGNKWSILLQPGGSRFASQEGYTAIHLHHAPDWDSINFETKFTLSIKDEAGGIAQMWGFDVEFPGCIVRGERLFIKRSDILDPTKNILIDGALCVDVSIQIKDRTADLYWPSKSISRNMLKLLESREKSDVSFNVMGEVFPAHSLILHMNAPILSSFFDQQNTSEVIIEDTSPEVFKLALEHVYSGKAPYIEVALKLGKELIDAANRYELVELKIAVENTLVRERILDEKNVADYILFADAQCCPLLKEYAIWYFQLHAREVLQSEYSRCLRESGELLSEITLLMNNGDEESMTVTELRKALGNRGLDVDGSKRVLVARLENAKRQRTE